MVTLGVFSWNASRDRIEVFSKVAIGAHPEALTGDICPSLANFAECATSQELLVAHLDACREALRCLESKGMSVVEFV